MSLSNLWVRESPGGFLACGSKLVLTEGVEWMTGRIALSIPCIIFSGELLE
jgi:hypothetical protein